MKFFVDTAEIDEIRELNELGMVDGVTTNPSLIRKSGRDIIEVTREICGIVSGPVSAEVTATEAKQMIAEGIKLAEIADNIAIKVPLTWDGLKACKALSDTRSHGKCNSLLFGQPSTPCRQSGCDLHISLYRKT